MTCQRRVRVSGRVQGVGFRYSTLQQVQSTAPSLRGFVKNLADGRVEAVFKGSEREVLELVAWCKHGPQGAEVTALEVLEEAIDPALGLFEIRR